MSARKYAQRTMCSARVGPDAPYASVGGGAATPTPNVHTPETTRPSDDTACQRTVYAPRGADRTRVDITCGSPSFLVTPDTISPDADCTTIEFGSAFTPWSKRTQTVRGARSTRSRYDGCVARTLACA